MIKKVVRPWKGPKFDWQIDVRVQLADGTWRRAKRGFNGTEKQAQKEGDEIAFALRDDAEEQTVTGEKPKKEVPTLEGFQSRFITEHLEANDLKPTTIETYKYRLRLHLLPCLGKMKLDEIDFAAVQQLKAYIKAKAAARKNGKYSPVAVNHTLGVLSKVLTFAFDIGVIDKLAWRFKTVKLKTPTPKMGFYDFAAFAALVEAATGVGAHERALVLLGGEAGLRRGELAALDWSDVNLANSFVTVSRTLFKGHETTPKGGTSRTVRMTKRLAAALVAIKPSPQATGRVLRRPDGSPHTETSINEVMPRITKEAGLAMSRKIHILRHTFCSHLAMRGAKAIEIMELAGHTDIQVTQRYMHLSPEMKNSAIRLLEQPIPEAAA